MTALATLVDGNDRRAPRMNGAPARRQGPDRVALATLGLACAICLVALLTYQRAIDGAFTSYLGGMVLSVAASGAVLA